MKVPVVNTKLNKSDNSVNLNEEVWAVNFNADLIAQVVDIYKSNRRAGTAHAKSRGMVRGGGRKPWAQKGTGRARQGSIRSPIWVGGGVTFVPNKRNWNKKITKRTRRESLKISLSKRLADETLYFVDLAADTAKDLSGLFKKVLVIVDEKDVYLKLRNIKGVEVIRPDDVNTMDVVSFENIIVAVEAVDKLEARLA